ncbi:hypothetical protein F3Y22_tig00110415pilonHSYRG00036 [Hibiscus syriacus]|uniref:Protein FAR1-RELATED SEQUENCE n=1 Tax=Hibiscus syriacus TaxID=106335 RepID=A0A6A3ASH4_HIBSY|nr:hypothetical protein F3Y22_tig00110415pilonHSYRG00036 [Hibiscus syriacus]
MDNTDVDNVKPTEECHEVHNVDESDRLVGQLFCSRDQAWHFYKGFAREHGFSALTRTGCKARVVVTATNTTIMGYKAVSKADIDEATTLKEVGVGTSQVMNYLTQQAGAIIMLDLHIKTSTMHFKEGNAEAIKSVIPYAKHRLCSWHLSRNAQANIGDPKFTAAFSKCMASWWTTKEFDIQWLSIVSEFNVQKHPWVIEKGNTRHLWAQAYLTGHFFANIRSTQRCESMNASLAIALKHKKTYLDVVRAIEDGISRMRMNELKADYLSSHTKPFQITKLVDLESHAAAIFTRESFRVFQDELIRETLYRIEAEIKSLSDECQHYILSKWTNDAKASAPSYVDLNVSPEVMQMARFAALRSTSSRLCYIASKTDESFKTARDEMKKLIEELENSFGLNHSVNQSIVVNNVRDPQRKQRKRKEVPKNKVEKKIRRCGYCNGEGHNKLTCPQVKLSLSTSTQPTSTDFFEDGME